MLRILIFLALLAGAAFGIAWIIDRPGDIVLTWQGYRVETSVGIALAIMLLGAMVLTAIWSIFRFVFRAPGAIGRRAAARRLDKGRAALSRGLIAIGAGDARLARKSAADAGRYLPDEQLVLLLAAQAAQLSGDRAAAAAAFEKLSQKPETQLLGFRGLHVEAQRRGDEEAALYYAHEAHKIEPLPWSAKAVLDYRAAHAQWEGALAALESHIAAKLVGKATGERQRAVLETAIALDKADRAPDEALRLARQALARAPDLVPATVLAARLLSRKGDMRKAAKLIESTWPRQRHPELAEAYLDLRPGDSNADRLAKAQALSRLAPHDPESHMIVARAALAARDYETVRKAMAPLVAEDERPTMRMCLVMAELEDAEFGDQGKVRAWLARSARAPRDPVWIADGVASKQWAPVSPVTGRLDAFVWQRPVERLGADIGADIEVAEWIKNWTSPTPLVELLEPVVEEAMAVEAHAEKEAAPPLTEIEATPAPAPEPAEPTAIQSEAEPSSQMPQQASFSGRPRGPRPVQKVVFPMAIPPDDPGPEETADKTDIRRIGLL